jgi:glutamate-1-semialdehyde 2,1-aminomutase
VTINPFRKVYGRLLLSRAKHRSLQGHPKLALKVARWLRAYSYDESSFFSSDSAPLEIQKQRREGFHRLAKLFRQRFPKTIAMTADLETAVSDLAFVKHV